MSASLLPHVDAMLNTISYIQRSSALTNLCRVTKDGDSLTRRQVRQLANSIITDMMENDIKDTPFVGGLMREIYISLEHPLLTIDEERLDRLYQRTFTTVMDDFEETHTFEVTDDVVHSYADFVCLNTCFYSGIPKESFQLLQECVCEALNGHIEEKSKNN